VNGLSLKVRDRAVEEIEKTTRWYERYASASPPGLQRAIDEAFEHIVEAPDRWPLFAENIRRYTLRRTPYCFFYTVTDNAIVVLAFSHQKRRPGYWSEP
jgi:plasmid stabilization system protein ParE